ncbi:MAG TPA: hypothetical protein VIY90_10350 [Steroidobacteraceae bacterium]
MANIYGSTGAKISQGKSVSLADLDAQLRAQSYVASDFKRAPGDRAPQFKPVTKWDTYVLIEVVDGDPKTTLFPESGFYHLRDLTDHSVAFLLEP